MRRLINYQIIQCPKCKRIPAATTLPVENEAEWKETVRNYTSRGFEVHELSSKIGCYVQSCKCPTVTLLSILTELAAIAEKFDGVEVPERYEHRVEKLRKEIEFMKYRVEKGE